MTMYSPHLKPKVRGHMPVMLPMRLRADGLPLADRLFNLWTLTALVLALAAVLIGPAFAQLATPDERTIHMILLEWTPTLAKGFGFNVLISVLSMLIGTVMGVFLGVLQVSQIRPIRQSAWLVTQFFRNSPWLVLLFYCILLIPFQFEIFGVKIPFPGWIKAVIGLSLPVMAYTSEFMRGAILSIPTGQWESAESLGFSRRMTLTNIILPQTVKRVLPSWMNLYAVLTMATPLVSIIGVDDVMALTRAALSAEGRADLLIPMYLYILSWFFLYCYPISSLTRVLERKYSVKL
ncbi:polar amino acid uptake family ABC transporter, permease protein [Roseovarius sp. TM1035]|jgi:polar amino acid transport system permease protein|uniref:amino acid ABC transporter permease n=1 Tax=Roseovarius TaxID=74030 RepID=UPI0001556E58|nr:MULTISPECIES: amino acid ABC transporter permease [Roseovarius]EDM32745.1 polar amino acid uptake family ABC transporter, permease protein [Roseovarius sp. TM1035]